MKTVDDQDLQSVSGGIWQFIVAAVVLYDPVTDFAEGMKAGYADGLKK